MKAWAESVKANLDDITFIADFNGALVKELGVEIDLSAANLGNPRSKRYVPSASGIFFGILMRLDLDLP